MIDGSKKGTSILCQEVVKKDRGGKKNCLPVCREVLFEKKMFAAVHTKKSLQRKIFLTPPGK